MGKVVPLQAVRANVLTGCPPRSSGLRVRLAGGNANNGTNAGASYANANNTASNTNSNYSSPLYFARTENTGD